MFFLTFSIDTSDKSHFMEQLIQKIASGNKDALAELYTESRHAIYSFALSITRNRDDSEDILHDTLIKVWQNAHSYHSQGTPMAWILTITKNLSLMKLREHNRKAEIGPEEWDIIFQTHDSNASLEDRHLLQTALTILSEDERQIVLLHAVSGLKHREISSLLNISLSNILSKYHRGLKKLKKYLESMQ